jgi:hypothetical protein
MKPKIAGPRESSQDRRCLSRESSGPSAAPERLGGLVLHVCPLRPMSLSMRSSSLWSARRCRLRSRQPYASVMAPPNSSINARIWEKTVEVRRISIAIEFTLCSSSLRYQIEVAAMSLPTSREFLSLRARYSRPQDRNHVCCSDHYRCSPSQSRCYHPQRSLAIRLLHHGL